MNDIPIFLLTLLSLFALCISYPFLTRSELFLLLLSRINRTKAYMSNKGIGRAREGGVSGVSSRLENYRGLERKIRG